MLSMTSTTTPNAVRPREVGNLYVGDEVLLPGDIFGTVTGFTDMDAPGTVTVQFNVGPARTLRTTDVVWVAAPAKVRCIVVPGKDTFTLWDCECSDCRRLQREARMDDDC